MLITQCAKKLNWQKPATVRGQVSDPQSGGNESKEKRRTALFLGY